MKKNSASNKTQETFNSIASHLSELANETARLVKEAKSRFDNADEQTKNKVVAGLAGAAGLVVAALGAHRLKKKLHRKKKEKKTA